MFDDLKPKKKKESHNPFNLIAHIWCLTMRQRAGFHYPRKQTGGKDIFDITGGKRMLIMPSCTEGR